MTTSEYNTLMTRIDAVGRENRDDVRALTKELQITRDSLSTCQGRCWVGEDAKRERRRFLYNILSACITAVVVSLLNHYGR